MKKPNFKIFSKLKKDNFYEFYVEVEFVSLSETLIENVKIICTPEIIQTFLEDKIIDLSIDKIAEYENPTLRLKLEEDSTNTPVAFYYGRIWAAKHPREEHKVYATISYTIEPK